MVQQSWIINYLKMYKISDEVIYLYWENYENLESEIDNRRENLSWKDNLNRYIPRWCTITIAIYNFDDAT